MTGPKPLRQPLRHERQPQRAEAPPPTDRQRKLHDSITARSSNVSEQLALLTVQANRVGASERDVRAVRERLLEGWRP